MSTFNMKKDGQMRFVEDDLKRGKISIWNIISWVSGDG
jgi:hypothetical protein